MKKVLFFLFIILSLPLSAQQGTGKKVLFIGDSVTDGGWGNDVAGLPSSERNHWDWNHLFGSGYMYLCASHFMGKEPEKELQFYNRGISGNTLKNLEDRWQSDCLDIQADVISILVGTNDIHFWLEEKEKKPFDYASWEARYRALIDKTIKDNPKCQVILCTPFVAKAGWAGEADNYPEREEAVRKLAAIIKQIAKDNKLTLIPFDEMFDETLKKYPDIPVNHWCWDGIHPTPATHQRMADLWIEKCGL